MAGAVIPVGVPLSPRNIYLRDPVFSITQTASRLMRTTIVAACISGVPLEAVPPPQIVPIVDVKRQSQHVRPLRKLPDIGFSRWTGAAALRGEELDDGGSPLRVQAAGYAAKPRRLSGPEALVRGHRLATVERSRVRSEGRIQQNSRR